ncbi:MAG: hypothetical protein ABSF26_02510 [Thermoguttaceae bacterium]
MKADRAVGSPVVSLTLALSRRERGPVRKRRGQSLVEMVVVMTVATAVSGVAIALLGAVLQLDGTARGQTRWVSSMGRLSEQFRRDVHQASAAAAVREADKAALRLQLPQGRSVVYRLERGGIVRREQTGPKETVPLSARPGGRADENRDSPQDRFALPDQAAAAIDIEQAASPRLVSLSIESPGLSGPTLRIEAALGRDHAGTQTEEPPKDKVRISRTPLAPREEGHHAERDEYGSYLSAHTKEQP